MKLFREDAKRWLDEGYYPRDAALSTRRITNRQILKLLWRQPGLFATGVYRVSNWFRRHHVRGVPGLLSWYNLIVLGIEINSHTEIGPGLYIAHPVGVVLVAERIGANASFIGATTLGMRNSHEFPRLGDGVFVGVGARILGGIGVGDGCRIGANAVLVEDAPAGVTMVGIPARPLRKHPRLMVENGDDASFGIVKQARAGRSR